jgi:uncharacterized protein YjbJ (UPF0337 family)
MMELNETWEETKEKLKRKFAVLSDGDLLLTTGSQDKLLSRLQIKLGKTKEEILKLISKL